MVARIREGWSAYRGRAVEPLVRESIFRMLPDERFGDAQYVGGYWTRKGDVEVDLVGAGKKTRPERVAFVGSIKWREKLPFGGRDLGRIAAQREEVPGTDEDTVLIGVSREGFDEQGRGLDVGPGSRRPVGSLEAVIPHLFRVFHRTRVGSPLLEGAKVQRSRFVGLDPCAREPFKAVRGPRSGLRSALCATGRGWM